MCIPIDRDARGITWYIGRAGGDWVDSATSRPGDGRRVNSPSAVTGCLEPRRELDWLSFVLSRAIERYPVGQALPMRLEVLAARGTLWCFAWLKVAEHVGVLDFFDVVVFHAKDLEDTHVSTKR